MATITAPEVDTRALVEAAQAGDMAAFGQLYGHYRDPVFRFVYARVGDRHTAEDIVADVFVRALRNLGRYQDQGKDVGAWLTTIARNMVTDHFKSGRVRRSLLVGDWSDEGVPGGRPVVDDDRRGDPAHVAEVNATSDALDAVLAQLTHQQRQVLALRFGEGLSVIETAAVLGLNVGAVKTTQFRACQMLRRHLAEVDL